MTDRLIVRRGYVLHTCTNVRTVQILTFTKCKQKNNTIFNSDLTTENTPLYVTVHI